METKSNSTLKLLFTITKWNSYQGKKDGLIYVKQLTINVVRQVNRMLVKNHMSILVDEKGI
jgi:hypothetical protein